MSYVRHHKDPARPVFDGPFARLAIVILPILIVGSLIFPALF